MRMRFFLPREFTLDTAPQPKDPRVHLVKVVARLEAVLRFSGIATEDAVGKKTKDLLRALDQSSWRGHSRSNWAVGGNVHLVGTPEQIVDWFAKLKRAGCDGMQVNFYDFLPDLDFFGKRVMPLLYEAGLRIDVA